MKLFKITIISVLALSCFLSLAPNAMALDKSLQDEVNKQMGTISESSGYGAPIDPRIMIVNIIRVSLGLLGMLFTGLTVYAGFLWMTAGGEDERVTKSKKLLYQATIGLIIIISSYGITTFAAKLALGRYDYRYYENEMMWLNWWIDPRQPQ